MTKIKIVDARGLSCPQPVVLAKQAFESNEQVIVIVDNETALENVNRLGSKLGCEVKIGSQKRQNIRNSLDAQCRFQCRSKSFCYVLCSKTRSAGTFCYRDCRRQNGAGK